MSKKLIITNAELAHPVSGTAACYQICALYEDRRMLEVTLQETEPEPRETEPQETESQETGLRGTASPENKSILNNIYVARVQNVAAGLSAAFVEIAKGQKCYLPLEDVKEPLFTKKISKKAIAPGDELVVQVVKEAVKTKDAVVTTNLSFSGEYLVLTSANHKTGISSKMKGADRSRLKALAQELRGNGQFGIIIRTNAAAVPEESVRAEFFRLKSEYDSLFSTAASRTACSCLRRERPFYQKMLMDTDKSGLEEVLTDNPEVFGQLQQAFPSASYSFRLYQDKLMPLAKLYNAQGQIQNALRQRVWLKSGANIIIQPTEALTVIDVNSGKNISKKDKQQYLYKINLEAAEEIARQLRLRNISGIIIIDFIDLYEEGLNTGLLEKFRSYLKQDPVPVQLAGMTKLGLVELTRKKQRKSLAEQLVF